LAPVKANKQHCKRHLANAKEEEIEIEIQKKRKRGTHRICIGKTTFPPTQSGQRGGFV